MYNIKICLYQYFIIKMFKCTNSKIKTTTPLHELFHLSFAPAIHEYILLLVYLWVDFRLVNSILRRDRILLCYLGWPQSAGFKQFHFTSLPSILDYRYALPRLSAENTCDNLFGFEKKQILLKILGHIWKQSVWSRVNSTLTQKTIAKELEEESPLRCFSAA